MAENPWVLNDSAPVSLAQEFDPVPSPWTQVWWSMPWTLMDVPSTPTVKNYYTGGIAAAKRLTRGLG